MRRSKSIQRNKKILVNRSWCLGENDSILLRFKFPWIKKGLISEPIEWAYSHGHPGSKWPTAVRK